MAEAAMAAIVSTSSLTSGNFRIDFMTSSPFVGCREQTHRRLRRIASLTGFVLGRRGQELQVGTTGVKSELQCSHHSPCNRFIAGSWTLLLCQLQPTVSNSKNELQGFA